MGAASLLPRQHRRQRAGDERPVLLQTGRKISERPGFSTADLLRVKHSSVPDYFKRSVFAREFLRRLLLFVTTTQSLRPGRAVLSEWRMDGGVGVPCRRGIARSAVRCPAFR